MFLLSRNMKIAHFPLIETANFPPFFLPRNENYCKFSNFPLSNGQTVLNFKRFLFRNFLITLCNRAAFSASCESVCVCAARPLAWKSRVSGKISELYICFAQTKQTAHNHQHTNAWPNARTPNVASLVSALIASALTDFVAIFVYTALIRSISI